jgi:hypothetical protein
MPDPVFLGLEQRRTAGLKESALLVGVEGRAVDGTPKNSKLSPSPQDRDSRNIQALLAAVVRSTKMN